MVLSGMYQYILSGDARYLSVRGFSDSIKQQVYEKQKGYCVKCGEHFEITEMEADYITPGGKATVDNCQVLCRKGKLGSEPE